MEFLVSLAYNPLGYASRTVVLPSNVFVSQRPVGPFVHRPRDEYTIYTIIQRYNSRTPTGVREISRDREPERLYLKISDQNGELPQKRGEAHLIQSLLRITNSNTKLERVEKIGSLWCLRSHNDFPTRATNASPGRPSSRRAPGTGRNHSVSRA